MRRCEECALWEPAGAPGCARCARLVDEIVEEGWRAFLAREFPEVGPQEERAIAELVTDEPDRHQWRVVDAAYDRLTCGECGGGLGRGPVGCGPCDLANGFRFIAVETDRPHVPPGNEHALRVNVAAVRRPHWVSEGELLLRRLSLPVLLEGRLPTTAQAQATRALYNEGASMERIVAAVYDWGR
ncbi:hypothetical protein [Nonomuraea roseoviolacea]|uniref:Uncharacterized protein n=1 Tax=Nonomuraea roseoviolacea subsp. carminata TaxID=160689 RepID=A0ABT1JS36_9ACTN|nr:hypothetical protein [Nonomuraea roseoviolacea]MCP2344139.1 hypothetical protein [Nonomuraea roseoviolacea subsp. carminata]